MNVAPPASRLPSAMAPRGYELHRRLDTISQETRDMAAQHGSGLSGDEQRVFNQELDQLHRLIAG